MKIKKFLNEIENPIIREIAENTFTEVYIERRKISGNKAFYSARAAALAKIASLFALDKEVK